MKTKTRLPDMATRDRLNNGAQIIKRQCMRDHWLVIAYYGGVHPWVVWRVDRSGSAYWGHYYMFYQQAKYDFDRRIHGDNYVCAA